MSRSLGRTAKVVVLIAAMALLTGYLDVSSGNSATSSSPMQDQVPNTSNGKQTISGDSPPMVVVGSRYLVTPTASDPDGDTLVFGVENLPPNTYYFTSTAFNLDGLESAFSNAVFKTVQ